MSDNKSKSTTASIGKELYDGADTVGKTVGWIYFVIAIVVGIIFVLCGINVIRNNDDKEWDTVKTTVRKAKCNSRLVRNGNSANFVYDCDLKVDYKVQDKDYTEQQLLTSGNKTKYGPNSILTIKYFKKDPKVIKPDSMSSGTLGTILICIGLLCVFIGWCNWYLTRKSKLYSAASGVGTIGDVVF